MVNMEILMFMIKCMPRGSSLWLNRLFLRSGTAAPFMGTDVCPSCPTSSPAPAYGLGEQ